VTSGGRLGNEVAEQNGGSASVFLITLTDRVVDPSGLEASL
jgi:hypothetical protein